MNLFGGLVIPLEERLISLVEFVVRLSWGVGQVSLFFWFTVILDLTFSGFLFGLLVCGCLSR